MTRYILDTTHLTLLQRLHPILVQQLAQIDFKQINITVITVEEQVQGWISVIRKSSQASQLDKLIWAYQGLRDVVQYLN